MEDSILLKIALISAAIGLITLFVIMYYSKIPEMELNNITDQNLGQKIKISGIVERVRLSSNNQTTFITLIQKCSIDVVSFDAVNLTRNQNIIVEGVVQEYQNKKEIIADKITIK